MKPYVKMIILVLLFAYVIGTFGSTGYLFWIEEYVCAVSNIIMSALAFPFTCELLSYLKDDKV